MRTAVVNLTSGGLSGGYRKYLQQLLPLLHDSPLITQLDVLSPSSVQFDTSRDGYWSWPDADGMTGYKSLRSELARRKPDVVFFPSARLVNVAIPTVVMVRNMEPLVAPFAGNSMRDGLKNVGRRVVARWSCRRATRVIAVSDFVRDFVVDHWNVPPTKIGVVPHGVEPPLEPGARIKPQSVAVGKDPWIFAAGSIRPARGLEDLLGALSYIHSAGIRPRIVVAGATSGDGETYRQKLQRAIDQAGHAGDVVWAGPLSQPEMAWCYANCSAFVMTSRVEACPNTALEALAYGCVCVATTRRPMPETFGDAARYYEAGDQQMLAEQIVTVLRMTDVERNDLARKAVSRAADFTWQKTAEGTIRELQLAAHQS